MAEESNETNAVDLSGLGSFDFMPSWAKGDAKDNSSFKKFAARGEGAEDRSSSRRTSFGGDDRQGRPPRRSFNSNDRRSVDGAIGGDERPRRERRGDVPPPRRAAAPGERMPFNRGDRARGERPARPFIKPMDADIRILPNQKDLGAIIRKIISSHQAYPLKQLANLFLDNPASCVVRVAPRKNAEGEAVVFHQCKACGHAVLSQEELARHAVQEHLLDYFEAEVVDCEPPKGVFNCVAKCGITGELIGPPNLHGYDARIREMLRTRFPGMREEDYRAKLEMVHDADTIEAWRAAAVKKTVYKKKGVEDAPALEREQAELEFRQTFMPGLLTVVKTLSITAEQALATHIKPLLFACRDAIAKERRFPAGILFALRGAFHNRKLVFFRANDPRGMEFVTAAKPVKFDATNAIPELVTLLDTAEKHPSIPAAELIAMTCGGDETQRSVFAPHFAWLAEKGNLVHFCNGLASPAAENPVYRPPRQKKNAEMKSEEAATVADAAVEAVAENAADAADAPVVENAVENTERAEAPKESAAAETVAETEAAEEAAAPANDDVRDAQTGGGENA